MGADGCAVDVYIAALLCPGVEFLGVAQKRQSDAAFKTVYDQAKVFYVENEFDIRPFNPPSSVAGKTEYCFLPARICQQH